MRADGEDTTVRIALPLIRQAFTGGVEKFQNTLACFLAEAGHEVTLLCRSAEGTPHPAVKILSHRPPVPGSVLRLWAFDRWVKDQVLIGKFDVVYALGRTTTHDCIRLGGGSHARFMDLMEIPLRPWSLAHRHAVTQERRGLTALGCRRIVANARMVADDVIRRYNLDSGRVQVIHNGVDLGIYNADLRLGVGAALRRELGFDDKNQVILFLGHGFARKGLEGTLKAFVQISIKHPQTRLLVVGTDSRLNWWKEQAHAAGIADKVVFLGPRRDAPACFAAADIYLLPTQYDPFANSTLEALACGLPVITTRMNGGHEVLTDGLDGSVIDPNHEAIAKTLDLWLQPEKLLLGKTQAILTASKNRLADRMKDTLEMLVSVAEEK